MASGFFNPSAFSSSTTFTPVPAGTSIFSTPTQSDAKLGGTGNPLFSSSPITGMGDSVKMQDPMNGEVDPLIVAQFEELRKALKENREASETFALSSSDEPYDNMNELIEKLASMDSLREVDHQKAAIKAEMGKSSGQLSSDGASEGSTPTIAMHSSGLLELSRHDNRMAAHISKCHDLPNAVGSIYNGGSQTVDFAYMKHEKSMVEYDRVLSQIEELLAELHPDSESGVAARRRLSQDDLRSHIQRFDEIFATQANQLYSLHEAAEITLKKLKEAYLDCRRNLYGRYATNPFERRQREEMKEKVVKARYASLKGLDAFPSQTAILSISEYCVPRSVGSQFAQIPVVGGGTFPSSGTTASSMFGGMKTPAASTPFSFSTSSVNPFGSTLAATASNTATTTAASVFSRPFTFASTAATFTSPVTSVFGTTPSSIATPVSATTTTTFGSTLSSSTSGTLFGGSSTLQQGSNKSLFGR